MKKVYLLFTLFTALAIASCTKEVVKEIYIEVPQEEGVVYIKPSIAPPVDAKTRAAHYDGTPTADELKIYNYALFIFKANGMLEASLISMPGHDGNGYTPKQYNMSDPNPQLIFEREDGSGNVLNPALDDAGTLTLSAGNKHFFAIVNAPAQLLAIQDEYLNNNALNRQALIDQELSFTDLKTIVGSYSATGSPNAVVSFTNSVAKNTDNRGFMMTSLDGFESKLLSESVDENDIKDIDLSVGRAVAKVSLASKIPAIADDPTAQPNGTLDVKGYRIINNPNKMYIMPKISNTVLLSPYYYDAEVTTASNAAKYFESHTGVNATYIPTSQDGAISFTYCIENANLTPKQGNATIALIKGVFHPINQRVYDKLDDFINNPGTSNTTINEGETFYRIWIPQYDIHSAGSPTGVIAGHAYDNNYYINRPTQQELDDYVAAHPEWGPITLEVVEYTDGECYYRLPLYNKLYENAPYTVKRNSYYKIDITSVEDAGYPDENGGPDPIDPDESLEPQTNIKATINVENWKEIDQSGAL